MKPSFESQAGEFRSRCRAAGLALTHQREVIYRAVLESDEHPTPERIFEAVRRQIPAISLATIYKNLHTFLDAGLLAEVSPHYGTLRLEANLGEHHHLVCMRCKAITDLEEDDVAPVHLKRRPPAGFRITRASVEFRGLCAACANIANQKN
jgi:Fur family peroxide stress response transcriptional regulator